MVFLYDIISHKYGKTHLEQIKVPDFITDNLKYKIRAYQQEAFQRYILCHSDEFEDLPPKPYHLLYNMATGSGKTLVMAGLMLYLYQKGYRNFLFFVNSNNIIKKTINNFINPLSSKYLFSKQIVVNGKEVQIKPVVNFEEADNENINIKFTTIQQLHIDLNSYKENSITYEDFKDKKIVLIADEAHHLSTATKKKDEIQESWEHTVIKILNQNIENRLLEFTATPEYKNKEIVEKYRDKIIFRYDLAQFRKDGYSKEINLIRSFYDEKDRIIQALILNLYRRELAVKQGINLKPVILFKAKKTIIESERNKANFHRLIDDFSAEHVEKIKATSNVEVVQKAFRFFEKNHITSNEIAQKIKTDFRRENCISANNEKEAEKNQILLNSLEDDNNPVRAVFAVQKLNEGWDVLNLFDIVRLYDSSDGHKNKSGKTTNSEAQLIGRGARYFPFVVEEGQNPYVRKFDHDPTNDLKVLEELYYHTKEDSRYISELKTALINTGIYEDAEKFVTKAFRIKSGFTKTGFYKNAKVVFNKKVVKNFKKVRSFDDLGLKERLFSFTLSSGTGKVSKVFSEPEIKKSEVLVAQKVVNISDIPFHVVRYTLTQNPFFYFDQLKKYFPNIHSLSNFIQSNDYLGQIKIAFKGPESLLKTITNADYQTALLEILQNIESAIKANVPEYEGSDYISGDFSKVFTNKDLKIYKNSDRCNGQEDFVAGKPWYVYNANYGTREEKTFVEQFAGYYDKLQQNHKDIYLVRNEGMLKIYNKTGKGFAPDFILFYTPKSTENTVCQIFIQVKKASLKDEDKWKEDFIQEIKETVKTEHGKYLLRGMIWKEKNLLF